MEMNTKIREKMAEVLGHESSAIEDDAELASLVNSSFVLVELVIELQEEFDVRFNQADMNDVSTVRDLIKLIENRVSS